MNGPVPSRTKEGENQTEGLLRCQFVSCLTRERGRQPGTRSRNSFLLGICLIPHRETTDTKRDDLAVVSRCSTTPSEPWKTRWVFSGARRLGRTTEIFIFSFAVAVRSGNPRGR